MTDITPFLNEVNNRFGIEVDEVALIFCVLMVDLRLLCLDIYDDADDVDDTVRCNFISSLIVRVSSSSESNSNC